MNGATRNIALKTNAVVKFKPAMQRLDGDLAILCHALGNPVRIKILRVLLERECIFGDIARQFPLAQSTVSQHLSVLMTAGMICREAVGNQSSYCIVGERIRLLKKLIAAI